MPARPPVSVVVPFLGSQPELSALASRLLELRRDPDDELIIADNRSTGTSEQTLYGGVIVHPAGGVHAAGFARNRGAARASGDWLVFIDADTEPEPDLLEAYFTSPPSARAAVLAGGIVDAAAPASPGRTPGLAARHAAARRHMAHTATLSRPAFAYAQTANCAVRRDAFVAAGGFEESVRSAEDADLCFRLLAAGWTIEACPGAVVRHRTRRRLGASLAQLARHGAGAAWCNRRHPGCFPPTPPWRFGARLARSGTRSAVRLLSGDTEAAGFAALELAEATAFEFGRLLPNRARRS
jgi:GT2 family glycosyltransferase